MFLSKALSNGLLFVVQTPTIGNNNAQFQYIAQPGQCD